MLDRLIKNILDVPGTDGLCIVSLDGQLLFRQMPNYILPELYDDLLRRVVALYEAMDDNFIPCDDYRLKYAGKHVFLRRGEHFIMLLLTADDVNPMSVRMVTNMAIKHIKPSMLGGPIEVPTVQDPVTVESYKVTERPEPAPAAEASSDTSAKKKSPRPERPQRSYRGQSY